MFGKSWDSIKIYSLKSEGRGRGRKGERERGGKKKKGKEKKGGKERKIIECWKQSK